MIPPVLIRLTDPDDRQAHTCLAAYSRFLAETIPAEGPDPIPLPLPDPEAYRPPHGAILVAGAQGGPLGCVCLRRLDATLGEVKRLYGLPQARGRGLARRLMRAVEDQARALGYRRLNLDTHAALQTALALYQAEGWTPIPPYSDFPATHWFSKPL